MNKPNKTELEYFIRYSLDSDKYKRYMELYEEIERLNNIIEKIQFDMVYLDKIGINQVKPKVIWERIELLKGVDKEQCQNIKK